MGNYKNPMTILEALVQLRNDLKLWTTNNLRVKLDKNLGVEKANKILSINNNGDIITEDKQFYDTKNSLYYSYDGDYTTKEYVRDGNSIWVKVSDNTPSIEDLTDAIVNTLVEDGVQEVTMTSDGFSVYDGIYMFGLAYIVCCTSDYAQLPNIPTTFTKGVYFLDNEVANVHVLKLYKELEAGIIKQLDERFIPSDSPANWDKLINKPFGDNEEIDIVAKSNFDFFLDETMGIYCVSMLQAGIPTFALEEGKTYYVDWDSTTYECVARTITFMGMDAIGIGNTYVLGVGENTNEPFAIGYVSDADSNAIVSLDAESVHNIRIYEKGLKQLDCKYVKNHSHSFADIDEVEYIDHGSETQIRLHSINHYTFDGGSVSVNSSYDNSNVFISSNNILISSETNEPLISFHNLDNGVVTNGGVIRLREGCLNFDSANKYIFDKDIAANGIYTGGKTAPNDGLIGTNLNAKGNLHLQGGTPFIAFYEGEGTKDYNTMIQSSSDNLNFKGAGLYIFDSHIRTNNALYTFGKVQMDDGKAGCVIYDGVIDITGNVKTDGTVHPQIRFRNYGSTSVNARIFHDSSNVMKFEGASSYTFDKDITVNGTAVKASLNKFKTYSGTKSTNANGNIAVQLDVTKYVILGATFTMSDGTTCNCSTYVSDSKHSIHVSSNSGVDIASKSGTLRYVYYEI